MVDGTGHVKLTDFGLATGALNPKVVESLKHKVGFQTFFLIIAYTNMRFFVQLDQAKDAELVHRSTLERRSLYRSMRNEDPRYVRSSSYL